MIPALIRALTSYREDHGIHVADLREWSGNLQEWSREFCTTLSTTVLVSCAVELYSTILSQPRQVNYTVSFISAKSNYLNILSQCNQHQVNILLQPNQPQLNILSQLNHPHLDILSQPNQPQLDILSQHNQPQLDILSHIRILPSSPS